jgi:glucose-6-phosphate isomerase
VANVDPDDMAATVPALDLKKTMAVVVSKSGTTIETVTNESLLRAHYENAGLDPAKHIVSVTSEASPMDDRSKYLECFHIWDYVGGRFSGTSMIGGVMLSFGLGYEAYLEILRGANTMDRVACEEDPKKNLPLLLALLGIWNHNFLNYPTLAVIPYSQSLHRFAAHLQQVDMESNGKSIDRKGNWVDFETGPIVFGEPGTNAQHSFYQLVHQGTPVIPVEYIGFQESQYGQDMEVQGTTSHEKLLANMFAQALALATGLEDENPNKTFPGNRPSHILLAKKLTPFVMGALWALVEHKIAFQGFIWDINSFDQEGVQLGKVLANRILGRIAHRKGTGEETEAYPLGDALLDEIQQL